MTLMLDPDIRDWVVLPLFFIMVVTGMLRHYVGMLMSAGQKVKIPIICQRAQYKLKQTTRLRSSAAHYMTTWRWHVRKQHNIKLLQEEADWCEEEKQKQEESGNEESDPMADMMQNPMKMMGGNMVFMVQNMVMMQGIQHFFSGFILLKVPFPLTAGFKNMFQKGVMDMPDLEPSYVSSVSWYFLVMYGLRSFFKIAIGTPQLEVKEQDQLLEKQGMQNPPNPNMKQDAETMAKQLRQEAENLELFLQHHKSDMDNVEKRLLGKQRYPKKKMGASDEVNFLLGSQKSKKKQ